MRSLISPRAIVLWIVLSHIALSPFRGEASITYIATFDMSKLRSTVEEHEGEQYCRFSYDSLYSSGEVGSPSLPVKYLTLSVPFNACNFKVEVTSEDTSPFPVAHRVLPVQRPIRSDGTEIYTFTKPSSKVYATNSYLVEQRASICGEGYLGGDNHVVTVSIYPLRYNPGQSKAVLSQTMHITISYDENATGDQQNAIVPISRQNADLREKERAMAKSMVVNPQDFDRFLRNETQVRTSPGFVLGTGNIDLGDMKPIDMSKIDSTSAKQSVEVLPAYNYTVITSRRFEPAFKRLLALKRQKGYSAGVTLVEDIMGNYWCSRGDIFPLGNTPALKDSAGCVRAYLRQAWMSKDDPLQYLLMGGRSMTDAPFRYGYSGWWDGDNPSESEKVIPTDLYYSNLDTNWNTDGDAYYGEKKSRFDYSPNIAVGRLLCESKEDIYNYTDKLLRHELNPGNGNWDYLSNMLVVECSNAIYHNEGSRILNASGGMFSKKILQRDTLAHPTTGEKVIGLWNENQFEFVSLHGHGNPKEISVGYQDQKDKTPNSILVSEGYRTKGSNPHPDTDRGIDCLQNTKYPSILYSIACTTMPYDDFQYSWDTKHNLTGRNFGQSFTLGKNYGGIAFLGNTRQGYFGTSCTLEEFFLTYIKNNSPKLGEAEAYSKHNSNVSHHIKLAHNLLGDPEVEMWTGIPLDYEGITVTRRDKSITVSGIQSQDTAIVAYCSNGNRQGMKRTSTGRVTFQNVSPNSAIMVYQHNYIPYIAPLLLQNDTIRHSQYVFASTVSAGRSVDSNRTAGDLVFGKDVCYEIEARGNVTLGDGVVVSKDAHVVISTPYRIDVRGIKIEPGGRVTLRCGDCVISKGLEDLQVIRNIDISKYNPEILNREVSHINNHE